MDRTNWILLAIWIVCQVVTIASIGVLVLYVYQHTT